MNLSEMRYRTRQFRLALSAGPLLSQDLQLVSTVLTPAQVELFSQLQSGEQAHAVQVLKTLLLQGDTPPDLQVAALLHDIGKIRVPLRVGERVLIVLGRIVCLRWFKAWGSGAPAGWRRAFVVAEQHPLWGAELAAAAGASALAVDLIAKHQSSPPAGWDRSRAAWLVALQKADNQN